MTKITYDSNDKFINKCVDDYFYAKYYMKVLHDEWKHLIIDYDLSYENINIIKKHCNINELNKFCGIYVEYFSDCFGDFIFGDFIIDEVLKLFVGHYRFMKKIIKCRFIKNAKKYIFLND